MRKLLIKRQFHNNFLGKTGIELIGEPGSGKTLQLVLEAHANDGILVIGYPDIVENRLKELKIDNTNMEVIKYNTFANSYHFGIGLNKPVYIDEIEIFNKKYNMPTNAYKYICGYSLSLENSVDYQRYINEGE